MKHVCVLAALLVATAVAEPVPVKAMPADLVPGSGIGKVVRSNEWVDRSGEPGPVWEILEGMGEEDRDNAVINFDLGLARPEAWAEARAIEDLWNLGDYESAIGTGFLGPISNLKRLPGALASRSCQNWHSTRNLVDADLDRLPFLIHAHRAELASGSTWHHAIDVRQHEPYQFPVCCFIDLVIRGEGSDQCRKNASEPSHHLALHVTQPPQTRPQVRRRLLGSCFGARYACPEPGDQQMPGQT